MSVLNIETLNGYAICRLCAVVSFQDGVELLAQAIELAVKNKVTKLLLDTRSLTGFPPPDTFDRYVLGQRCAESSGGVIKVALLAREELLDPERFGLTVARNRGAHVEAFAIEEDAVKWLVNDSG